MNAKFLLIPAASLSIVVPAHADVYLTVEQAQQLMFPGTTFTKHFVHLTDDQVGRIEDKSDTNVLSKDLKAWKTSDGGWFIADEVVGKHEFIPFALAITPDGKVKDVEILEYREAYGSDVRNPKWRAQFKGKTAAGPLELTDDIQNISGATLSSKHITDGVRRLMVTYETVLANH